MTSKYQFVGVSHSTTEERYYAELHGCPRCGSRGCEFKFSSSASVVMENGRILARGDFRDVTCTACRHRGYFLFELDVAAERRMEAAIEGPMKTAGYHDCLAADFPVHLVRLGLQFGPPGEPSEIIEAHELARELVSLEAQRPADRTQVDYEALKAAVRDTHNALLTAQELYKFLPEGVAAIPDDRIRSEDGRAARAAHPEWFQRAWIEAHVATWSALMDRQEPDYAARELLPATDPRSPLHAPREQPPILAPLSRGSVFSHKLWLAGEDGDRLVARDVWATEAKLSQRDLSSAELVDVKLERADLSFAKLHCATLTRVDATDASFVDALLAGAQIDACDFTGASFAVGKLGEAVITDTSFERADLDRSTWYRVQATRCRFAGAVFTNAAFDHARFTDCDFRGVSFAVPRKLLGTGWEAVFERCDLRDTDWRGQDLFRVRFVDCKLAGAHGAALMEEAAVERADLSPGGDGTRMGGLDEVQQLLQAGPYAPPPPPEPEPPPRPQVPFARTFTLPHAEADVVEDTARQRGGGSRRELERRGTELWATVTAWIPLPVEVTVFDDALAAYRATHRPASTPTPVRAPAAPPTAGQRARAIIDTCADRDASFEETVVTLVAAGYTRDQALEALVDPSSLDAPNAPASTR